MGFGFFKQPSKLFHILYFQYKRSFLYYSFRKFKHDSLT